MNMPSLEGLPSHWNRWGADDERGTLNYITDAVRARGVAEASTGRTVSLAHPITPVPLVGPLPFGEQPMPAGVLQMLSPVGSPAVALVDVLIVNSHHVDMTHIDALSHVPQGDQVYPGVSLSQAASPHGLTHGSTTAFAEGITTRGVFLDLAPQGRLEAGHAVGAADLESAEERAGVQVRSGDALVVRGGWNVGTELGEPVPFITVEAVEWMAEREISVYAGDIGDPPPFPPPAQVLAMHQIALCRLGMPLIDRPDVEPLAAICKELGRCSFLFVAAPMRVQGATGVPVNPLAIF